MTSSSIDNAIERAAEALIERWKLSAPYGSRTYTPHELARAAIAAYLAERFKHGTEIDIQAELACLRAEVELIRKGGGS